MDNLIEAQNRNPVWSTIFLSFYATTVHAGIHQKIFSVVDADVSRNGSILTQGRQFSAQELHELITKSSTNHRSTRVQIWMEAGEECDVKVWYRVQGFSSRFENNCTRIYYDSVAPEADPEFHGIQPEHYHEKEYSISFAGLEEDILIGRSISLLHSKNPTSFQECELMKVSLIGHPKAYTLFDDLVAKHESSWLAFVPNPGYKDAWLRLSIKFAFMRTKIFVNFEYTIRFPVVLVKFIRENKNDLILEATIDEKPRLLCFRGFKNEIQDRKGKVVRSKTEVSKSEAQIKMSKMIEILKKGQVKPKVYVAYIPALFQPDTVEIEDEAWNQVSTIEHTETTSKVPLDDTDKFKTVTDICLPYSSTVTMDGHLP